MSERKVLNKYYPPDFDPSKIPRLKLARDRQYVVRLMAPCNMKCTTCAEYIYKGKKFNARKETVQEEEYLGIKIFRFYIRCPRCLAEITFKTNPKDADYDLEHGATRNFQALTTAEKLAEAAQQAEEEDEKNNPMKLLEKRTAQSRLEMERIEALEELKELNERQATVDFESMLGRNQAQQRETAEQREAREQAEIDREVQTMLQLKGVEKTSDGAIIRRVKDVDSDEEERERRRKIPRHDPLVGLSQVESHAKASSSAAVGAKATSTSSASTSGGAGALAKLKGLVKVKKTTESKTVVGGGAVSAQQGSATAGGFSAGASNTQSNANADGAASSRAPSAPKGLGLVMTYSDSDASSCSD